MRTVLMKRKYTALCASFILAAVDKVDYRWCLSDIHFASLGRFSSDACSFVPWHPFIAEKAALET